MGGSSSTHYYHNHTSVVTTQQQVAAVGITSQSATPKIGTSRESPKCSDNKHSLVYGGNSTGNCNNHSHSVPMLMCKSCGHGFSKSNFCSSTVQHEGYTYNCTLMAGHAGDHVIAITEQTANGPSSMVDNFIGKRVTLRTCHNTFVRAHPGGEGARVDLQTYSGGWEKLQVVEVGNGKVAFLTVHGTYLRAHPGGEGAILDQQTFIGPWEQFTLEYNSGKWNVKTAHGTYLRAHPGGEGARMDLQTFASTWEQFMIEVVG